MPRRNRRGRTLPQRDPHADFLAEYTARAEAEAQEAREREAAAEAEVRVPRPSFSSNEPRALSDPSPPPQRIRTANDPAFIAHASDPP